MLKKKHVLTIMSVAVLSFLIGTMFNLSTVVSGGSSSPWDRVWASISELQTKVDSLNATLTEMNSTLESLEGYVETMMTGYVNPPAYDSGWKNLGAPPVYVTFTHNLGTTEVFVYIVGKEFGADTIHQWYIGGGGGGNRFGTWWYDLDISRVTVYRCGDDYMWDQVRVMIWKISEPPT